MSDSNLISEIRVRAPDGAESVLRCFGGGGAVSDALLILPAMGTTARRYQRFAAGLTRPGRVVALVDLRGFGDSSERAALGHDFGYRELVEIDIPSALAALRRRFRPRRAFLVGHSLGGQLATLAVGAGRVAVDGLVLIAAGTAHTRCWPGPGRTLYRALVQVIRWSNLLLPWYPGSWFGFGGDQPRRLMGDWLRNARFGQYRLAGSAVDYDRPAAARGLPVLAVEIPGDVIAPPGARAELVSRLPASHVTAATLSAGPREGRWRRHFGWIRRPAALVAAIDAWLDSGPTGSVAPPAARGLAAPPSGRPASCPAPAPQA